ncbi:MAG: hypothetical protein AAB401_03150 [Acidobacteriota bacterium]
MSPYDLLLFGLRGDIKNTTYFLTAGRLSHLVSDFFITRWYVACHRTWLRATVLRETAWSFLNPPSAGYERQIVTLDDVADILPQAAAFVVDSFSLTALGYDQWKQLVLLRQSTGEE